MKNQILYIHGGTIFEQQKDYLGFLKNRKISVNRRKWKDGYLDKKLGKNFQVIRPQMPLRENAKYDEWKIHFERYFPYLKDNIILMGFSLGGIFLAKYLSENKFPRKVLSVYLIGAPFNIGLMVKEESLGKFKLRSDLSLIEKNTQNLYLLFSKDDNVVPLSHAEKYRQKLKNAHFIILKNMNGHFRTSEFPEIIERIREDVRI